MQSQKQIIVKERILKEWNWIRAMRLAAGLAIAAQGLYHSDWFLILAGIVFTSMALLNTGCCAGKACSYNKTTADKVTNDTHYEEVV
jgi:hypothetical protein